MHSDPNTTISEVINAYIDGAEERVKAVAEKYEEYRRRTLGAYPDEMTKHIDLMNPRLSGLIGPDTWREYLRFENALPLDKRDQLETLRAAMNRAGRLAQAAKGSLRKSLDRYQFGMLPRWAVAQTTEARRRAIKPQLLAAMNQWTPANNLLLMGPTGDGKSVGAAHLVIILVARWLDNDGNCYLPKRVCWAPATALEMARRAHPLGQGDAPLVKEAMAADLLVLDDLGQETERGDTAIWDVVDSRYTAELPTVTTTGLTRAQLEDRYRAQFIRRLNREGHGIVGDSFPRSRT